MYLTTADWKRMLDSAGAILAENAELLSKIDAQTGDGDHGITVGKIAAFLRETAAGDETGLRALFEDLGSGIMSIPGGSAGPLYGTFFGGFAEGVPEGGCGEADLKAMVQAGYEEFGSISGAKVGDKTMMDALIPANEAIQTASGTPAEILRAGADAAKKGADATENFVAKFGRAKNYKEKTLGHKDPGAVSMSLIFEGFARALESSDK